MPSHRTVGTYASRAISQKRAIELAQNAFHSPGGKDGNAEKAIVGMADLFCLIDSEGRCLTIPANAVSRESYVAFGVGAATRGT